LKVVNEMDEQDNNPEQQTDQAEQHRHDGPAGKYIRLKPFFFIMLIFTLILSTAGLTIFALTFGDEKVVEVGSPERREFQKLYQAYDELKSDYYADIDQESLVNGAINGMIDALDDPYSDYMNQDEAAQFEESISSSFQGIGAEIQERNGVISVVSPIKNSPAEKAGILTNDNIIAVDGENIQGMGASEAVLLIRGEKGTSVTLTIQRGEMTEPLEIKIVRDEIPIETIYAEMLEDNVAHIQITSFSQNTYDELLTALTEMEDKGMEALVLDVRQNPGGLLKSAIDISNLFIEDGKPLFQTKEKDQDASRHITHPDSLNPRRFSRSCSESCGGPSTGWWSPAPRARTSCSTRCAGSTRCACGPPTAPCFGPASRPTRTFTRTCGSAATSSTT
jgi:carboxyl-terminal processing protease